MFDYKIISQQQSLGKTLALVTVIQTKGSTPREIGAKMLVAKDQFWGTIGGGKLELLALEKSRQLIKGTKSEKMSMALCSTANQCCGGYVELFVDVIQPRPQLYIFGAGHVGQALISVLSETDFEMSAIDTRAEWTDLIAKPQAHVISEDPVQFAAQISEAAAGNIYAVVLTHSHSLDENLIKELSHKNLAYLGLIGSNTKWQRFQSRLKAAGISEQSLSGVQCPMGIPLGGKAPKEVAISIAAGLIQELSKHKAIKQSLSSKIKIEFEEDARSVQI